MEYVCIFDDCDEVAKYALTARWPDGQEWRREVCLTHVTRGIHSLLDFREPEIGKPSLSMVPLV